MIDKLGRLETGTLARITLSTTSCAPDTQLSELQAALQVLEPLQYCHGTHVELQNFTLTPTLAAELVSVSAQGWCRLSLTDVTWPSGAVHSTPKLPPLRVFHFQRPLTDPVVAKLCQQLSTVDTLLVDTLSITAPLPQGLVAPWRVVTDGDMWRDENVADWARQARLLGSSWVLNKLCIGLSLEQVCVGYSTGHVVGVCRRMEVTHNSTLSWVDMLCLVTCVCVLLTG